MADRREKDKKKLRYAAAKERAEKHDSGFESMSVLKPKDLPWYQIKKAGTYKFDVLPYVVGETSRKFLPRINFADVGYLHYERTYCTHPNVGPNRDVYVCLSRTFGKPCPPCQHAMKLGRSSHDDENGDDLRAELKSLIPKERQLFLVRDHDDEYKIKLWDYSYHLFGKLLDAKIRGSDDEDNYANFFHLDGGMTLKVSFESKSIGGGKDFFIANNIEMRARAKPLPESILDDLPCLDDLVRDVPYGDYSKVFLGESSNGDEDGPEEGSSPSAKSPSAKSPKEREREDDEEDDDEKSETAIEVGDRVKHGRLGVCEVVKKDKKTGELALKDAKDKTHKGIDPAECFAGPVDDGEDGEDDDDAFEPAPSKKTRAKEPEEDEPDEDELEANDEEPEEKPAKGKKPKK